MRTLIILFLLTFISCKEPISEKNKTNVEKTETKNSPDKTAIDFINNYVKICNKQDSEQVRFEWIYQQKTVTENFKSSLRKIIAKAKKKDSELGLGFDPIFNTQDYPENGFELKKSIDDSNFIILKGKDWEQFKLKIKMSKKNENYLVDGIGIINFLKKNKQ